MSLTVSDSKACDIHGLELGQLMDSVDSPARNERRGGRITRFYTNGEHFEM